MEYGFAVIVLVALVALVVLRPVALGRTEEPVEEARVPELEAAKEAKYREIRDAELDYRMGKLSEKDWKALDGELRGEAVEILRELDEIRGQRPLP